MTQRVDFWRGYADCCRKAGVPDERVRWYLRWAERFARAVRGVPLRERATEDVKRFLEDLKADETLAPWQVEQARKAIGVLYRDYLRIDPRSMPTTRVRAARDRVRQPRQLEALHGPLLESVRTAVQIRHYSPRTEEAYLGWIRRFISFHDMKPPENLTATHIRDFLGYLATEQAVASSTQNQALNAIVFLYSQVLGRDPGDFSDFPRAKAPHRTPAPLSEAQIEALLGALEMPYRLMAGLMSAPL